VVGCATIFGAGNLGGFVFIILAIIIGFVLYFYSRKIKNTLMQYKCYNDLIIDQNLTSISGLASATDEKHEVVVADLMKMIGLGFFPGARVNIKYDRIFLAGEKGEDEDQLSSASTTDTNRTQEDVVTCGGCGANNKVVSGKVTECQFCGAPLK